MAKLVDALASGASGGNSVEVQVLSWAPIEMAQCTDLIQFYFIYLLPNPVKLDRTLDSLARCCLLFGNGAKEIEVSSTEQWDVVLQTFCTDRLT